MMNRAPLFIAFGVIILLVAKMVERRRHSRRDLIGRMSNQVAELSRSKPVESLVDDVDAILKEIRKQIKR
ncbi:MAG: hypothetical protein ACKVVP_01575 [Chloroflexota bacterium]